MTLSISHDLRRQSRVFDSGKLASAKIAVIGDGAISNFLCAYLAGLGIGEIVLIGNGVRIGKEPKEPLSEFTKRISPKVKNISETVCRINPDLRVSPYFSIPHRLFVEGCSVVVDATNDPESKFKAYRYCKELEKLLVSCSSSGSSASAAACHFGDRRGETGISSLNDLLMKEFSGTDQGSFTSGIAAVLAADEIRKEVCPMENDQRLERKVSYSVFSQRRFFRGAVPRSVLRYDRESERMLKKARERKALVVGAGGIGTYVLLNLSMLGMHIDIYDHDLVESHNLNRQIIHFGSVGKNKAEAAAEKLQRLDRRTRIRGFARRVTADVLKGLRKDSVMYDVVFSCVDNWECRQILNNHCTKAPVPFFNGGVSTFECYADYFIPGETHCLECSNNYRQRIQLSNNTRSSCANLEANVVMPNAMAGALMVGESMRVFYPERVPACENKNLKYFSKAGSAGKFVLESRLMRCNSRKYYKNDCRCHKYFKV